MVNPGSTELPSESKGFVTDLTGLLFVFAVDAEIAPALSP